MRVVIDTNVVISGTFFGGKPRQVLEAAADGRIAAFATTEIVDEYQEVVEEMIARRQGHLRRDVLAPFEATLSFVVPRTKVEVCRDPDDDKFIGCAVDARAINIVSGDKDLLTLGSYKGVEMMTAAEFCKRYL